MKKIKPSIADLLFPNSTEQDDFAESIVNIPPEQRKLHTDTYDFTVETIVEKILNKSIYIPEYQRRYVWTDTQASKLIESLIIQCPIPVIYLNQEKDERLSVIDGNQRLNSILKFFDNRLRLTNLTAYPELENSNYFELDGRIQRHISNRALRCIVILKETHPQVKFDVFERLNTGSVKLNPQELRHGIYFGDAISLASKIIKSSEFLELVEIKNDKRMKSEELVLRYLALSEDFASYKKPLAVFINQYAERNRKIPIIDQKRLSDSFKRSLNLVNSYLGDLSFKIFSENYSVESRFNAALFDAEMISFGNSNLPPDPTLNQITKLKSRLAKSFKTDERFRKSISIATSDEQQVSLRVEIFSAMLKGL